MVTDNSDGQPIEGLNIRNSASALDTHAEIGISPLSMEMFEIMSNSMNRETCVSILSESVASALAISAVMSFYIRGPHRWKFCQREKDEMAKAYDALVAAQAALAAAQKVAGAATSQYNQMRILRNSMPGQSGFTDDADQLLEKAKAIKDNADKAVEDCQKAVDQAQAGYARAIDAYCNCAGVSPK